MKTRLLLLAVFLMNSSISSVIAQNAGDLNPDFNGTGVFTKDFYGNSDIINDIAVQHDQKIVSVGVAFTPEWNIDIKIIRVLPEGTLDPDFGEAGVVTYNSGATGYYETHAMAVYIKDDGKILVAGGQLDEAFRLQMLLIQLNPDGSFDPDFGNNGVSVEPVSPNGSLAQDITLNEDGQILVAGTVADANFNDTPAIVRFNDNGSLDATFGNNSIAQVPVVATDNEFTSICLQTDGKILASGHLAVESEPGVWYYVALVARFLPTGEVDADFGENGIVTYNLNGNDDEFFGMALTTDKQIVCGGFTSILNVGFDMFMMKFDSTGNVVTDFGDNGIVTLHKDVYNVIYDLLLQPDNKILVCGSVGEFAPGNNDWALVRYLENGQLDASFGTNGAVITDFFGEQDEAQSLALAGNERIYAGGKTLNSATTSRDFTIACYLNDLNTSITHTAGFQTASFYPNPAKENLHVINNSSKLCNDLNYRITDLYGRTVKQGILNAADKESVIAINSFPPAVYLIRITDAGEPVGRFRFVKTN
jgi:uncharacterized delta-60 repeat protein